MPQKRESLTYEGVTYTVATLTTKNARGLETGENFRHSMIRACLNEALEPGQKPYTVEDVDNLPFYQVFVPLIALTFKVNDINDPSKKPVGEEQPTAGAAVSLISTTSTPS